MFSQLLQSRHRYQPRIQSPTAFPAGKCQPGGSFPGRSKPSSVAEHPCQPSSNRAQLLVFRKQKSQFPNSFLRVFIFTLQYSALIAKPGSPSRTPDSFTSFCTERKLQGVTACQLRCRNVLWENLSFTSW